MFSGAEQGIAEITNDKNSSFIELLFEYLITILKPCSDSEAD